MNTIHKLCIRFVSNTQYISLNPFEISKDNIMQVTNSN